MVSCIKILLLSDGNKFDDLLNTKSRNLLSRHKRDTYEELAMTAEVRTLIQGVLL